MKYVGQIQKPEAGDKGYDLYAAETVEILPGQTKIINVNLRIEIPKDCVGQIWERSGNNFRVGAGVVDPSFRGPVGVKIYAPPTWEFFNDLIAQMHYLTGVHVNKSDAELGDFIQVVEANHAIIIEEGQRIAQLLIVPAKTPRLTQVDSVNDLSTTKRGDKGFGSTGK